MDSKVLVKATPKPLLLRDYLLDDFSSCSSSGFRSYPRRQCCTTVRFLLEIDMMKNKHQEIYKKKAPPKIVKNKPPASSPPSTISAFQRASEAVIRAVKSFPFASVKSSSKSSNPKQNKTRLAILPRSLSRKLLKRSFWKKSDFRGIDQGKPEAAAAADEDQKSKPPTKSGAARTTSIGYSNSSISESSNSKKSDDSWSDSDFTVTTTVSDDSFSGNFSSTEKKNKKTNNDAVPSQADGVGGGEDSGDSSSITDATTTSTSTTTNISGSNDSTNSDEKTWTNEEKEQFSPVSVLDCPFNDEEDEVCSPFRHRLTRVEGTTKKLIKKLQRFERLAQVEPLNLEAKITESDHKADGGCPERNPSSESKQNNPILDADDDNEEEEEEEEKALKLLQLLKATEPSPYSSKLNADDLLLDFFRERLLSHHGFEAELLNAAKDWLKGDNSGEALLEWKVQKNREAYIRDMEMSGEWRNLAEENQEIALDLETEIFASLMDELWDD